MGTLTAQIVNICTHIETVYNHAVWVAYCWHMPPIPHANQQQQQPQKKDNDNENCEWSWQFG